jgi:hypothetical protein
MPGCKKEEKRTELYATDQVPEIGELRVTFVSPKDQTSEEHEAETIVAVFDHPFFPLTALEEQKPPAFMKIDPQVPGTARWLNPKTLTFTPEKRFPFATDVQVTLPAGIKTFEGYVLRDEANWSFQTIRPRLIQHFPLNKQKWLKLDTQVLLVFNQPVFAEENKKFIKITGLDKHNQEFFPEIDVQNPSARQLKKAEIQADPDEVLLLEPEDGLVPESTYYVELRTGLQAKEGSLGMKNSRIFEFFTFNEFRFEFFESQKGRDIYQPIKFQFSNPVQYKEFISKIRFEPEVSIPDYYDAWDQSNSTLWLSLTFQPETQYKLWIHADLQDEFGNTLGKEINLVFTTPPYPRSVTMETGQGLLEAYGDLRYPISAVNAEEIFIHAGTVPKDDVIPLLNSQKIFWTSEKFTKSGLFKIEKFIKLDSPRNKKQTFPIEVKDQLDDKYGFTFLQLDTLSEDKWERYPKAFLQISELGISAKFSKQNNCIWVTELQTGIPVEEAEIEIRDDSNRVCWRGKTDADGMALTPGWNLLNIRSQDKWSKPRQWVFASRGNDTVFLSSEWGTGVYPYHFDIEYDWNPQPLQFKGYVFTERGIYRAGETVHIKGILRGREKDDWIIPQLDEVICEIFDPFQKSAFKEKIQVDSFGSLAFDFETEEDAPLGEYQIETTIPSPIKDKEDIKVFSSFRVEAFRPAEFEVFLRTADESYTFGDTYQGELRAAYLFGGAMSGQDVRWYLRLNPTRYSPPGHKGYVFGDQVGRWETPRQDESRLLSSGESVLDEDGKIRISASIVPEKEKDSVFAVLEATVRGPSRRSVTNRIQTFVHRGDFYIGLRPRTTFLTKGDKISISLIATETDGHLLSDKKIRLSLIKREWHSVRKSEFGGRYRWISETKDLEIDTRTIQTKNEEVATSFLPEKSGFYILKAEGKDRKGNLITTTTYFYVTGKDYVPWERQDGDAIELVTDSSVYQPGDKAKILVKSPYESAKAWITVERDHILHSQVVELQGSSDCVEIPILSEYIPNVFVSVLLVQGRVSSPDIDPNEDIGKPSFKIGYVELAVDPSEKRLDIDIQTDRKDYSPGDDVQLSLQTKNWKGEGSKASIAVAVVDVGVLNLIGYQTPDPFSHFYSHQKLSVQTSEIRQHVIGQRVYTEKGEGGGVGKEMKAAFAPSLTEVELRGDFKFTAYWNPSLLTDDEGKAAVTFKLPDNLTTFRVMAVAQTPESEFGRNDMSFRVTKRLLLQPSLPRFARVGDAFRGGVVVHNHSSEKGQVVLNCRADGIQILGDSEREFTLDPGKGTEALFSFKVDSPGQARLSFRARMGEDEDGVEILLPLKIPRPKETVALSNSTTETTEEQIRIPQNIFPFDSAIQFLASASALSGLKGSVDFLTDYPYLCLEQRLSRILPFILAENLFLDFRLSELNRKEIREYVQENINQICTYQKPNGGFGLWPDSQHDSPFNSCYAAFALLKARQTGYAVDDQRMKQLVTYLQSLVRGKLDHTHYPYSEKSWTTVKAFTLYCLALSNQPEPSHAERLFTEKERLSLLGRALLLKAIHQGRGSLAAQNSLLQDLLNKIKISPTEAHFEDDEGRDGAWIYSSNLRTTAVILQSLIEIGSDDPHVPQIAQWLVKRKQAGRWSTTQENFYVFYALNDFYQKYEDVQPDFNISVALADSSLLKVSFNKAIQEIERAEVPISQFYPGKTIPLTIEKKGAGTLYYQTRMTYAPQKPPQALDQGFSIYKDITTLDGTPLSSIQAGSLVAVTLQIVVPRESLYIVVDDPLPAGLEAVNPVYVTESQEMLRKLGRSNKEHANFSRWRGFNHMEMYDDRVVLFADSLLPGLHTHRYLARALTPGTFHAPGTKIEEMYAPEVFGRSSEIKVEVTK